MLIGRADTSDLVIPDPGVSRTHCVLSGDSEGWTLRDRSRHGCLVDGVPVQGSVQLREGSRLKLGAFILEYTARGGEFAPTSSHTVASLVPAEQLVAPDAVERAVLIVEDGPGKGHREILRHARIRVGGPGTKGVVLPDPALVVSHLVIELARGRPMLVPGKGAAFLEGERIAGRIPLLPGETVRIGDTRISVASDVVPVRNELSSSSSFGEMVGSSSLMKGVFSTLRRIAAHNAPVLLFGESGTGKELASRAVHDHSPRAQGPFVAINCGAITESLFESELFGHEKGAFTGASARRDGAFHKANGGTLLLDEIGELPEAAQVKLLRALETGEIRRVGSHEVSFPDVRLIAATNRDLNQEVAEGRFRADLFFRLAVLPVRLPALRERPGDLPLIAKTLAARMAPGVSIRDDALVMLQKHPFPGNVRELRNVLTRAYVLGGPLITPAHIQFSPWAFNAPPPPVSPQVVGAPSGGSRGSDGASGTLEDNERKLLIDVMARHDQNRSSAARELGIARSTLIYKLKKFGLA